MPHCVMHVNIISKENNCVQRVLCQMINTPTVNAPNCIQYAQNELDKLNLVAFILKISIWNPPFLVPKSGFYYAQHLNALEIPSIAIIWIEFQAGPLTATKTRAHEKFGRKYSNRTGTSCFVDDFRPILWFLRLRVFNMQNQKHHNLRWPKPNQRKSHQMRKNLIKNRLIRNDQTQYASN